MLVLLVALTLVLAYANGANDVSKGIATLVGSGVSDYRRAVGWGTLWTMAGGVCAMLITTGLIATFSGKGLLEGPDPGPGFLVAVACGAIGWLAIATWTGLPVSTTHALVGGLAGAGIAAVGVDGVLWGAVGRKAALPLALSPLISLALMALIFPLIRLAYRRFEGYCVCLERQELAPAFAPALATGAGTIPAALSGVGSGGGGAERLHLIAGAGADCPPQVVSRVQVLDSLHWLSSGCTSFFRGLNDTPKVLALGVAAAAAGGLPREACYVLVALAMGAGSSIAGARVTGTLAGKVTPMTPGEGFSANLVTSVLVASASTFGLPVSTTHVSTTAIIGIGLHGKAMRWRTVRDLLLGWVVTLPVAGALAYLVYRFI
ncbi:MAG: inorganic phosphate transporter [Gemmatimonadales bacterium]